MVKGFASFHVKAAMDSLFVEYFILEQIYVKTVNELKQGMNPMNIGFS